MVLYVVGAALAKAIVGGPGEVFPVSTWSLFCSVPNEIDEYAVRTVSVDGAVVPNAPYYQESGDWFAHARSIQAYVAIQTLGKAIAAEDAEAVEDVRRYFEPLYLGRGRLVSYRVVRRVGPPIEVWRTKAFRRETQLAEFETGR